MDHASYLLELIHAECPVTWASENLVQIGYGSAATVYEHPGSPELVVRVSDYPDGWFMYAKALMDEEAEKPPFYAPRVEWIGEHRGVFFGVSERLGEIDGDSEMSDVVENVIRAFGGRLDGGWNSLEHVLPGFREFAMTLNARLDLRPENFMHRNGVLVFNDPYSSIPFHMEKDFREGITIPTRNRATPSHGF